jgi:RHS repeat-associated protein
MVIGINILNRMKIFILSCCRLTKNKLKNYFHILLCGFFFLGNVEGWCNITPCEGKEYISDFDWNKYDFTGRTFDSWTLRALQVDPMATKYYSTSPYALWLNNPLRVIDPTGMWTDEPQQGQQPTTYDDLNFLQKMFYNIISLMNAQGKAVNKMHGKTETTEEENIMASIEYTTGAVLLLQAHTEMARSAGKVSSSNKNTSVVKEASIAPESIGVKSVVAPANAVKGETQTVYRVFGGDAKALGKSWTPIDPGTVANYRDVAGLPNANTGQFIIKGTTNNSNILLQQGAVPLDGNIGGLMEYKINDITKITINGVWGVNPPF